MSNQEEPQVQIEENTTPEPEVIDASDLSDEDYLANLDNIDDNNQIVSESEDTPEVVNEATPDNTPEVDPTSVNADQQTDFTPPFDEAIFNSLPDDFKEIFKPIKANGAEITPTPDKMIQLMQLGSKYYADREQIKPQLMSVKALEKAGIDQDQLNMLIDINNGDKTAIARFLKDKEIDIFDIDENNAESYKPQDHSISEADYKLDQVVAELEQTETFQGLIENIAEYDEHSKESIKSSPEILQVLNTHKENGIYDSVMSRVAEGKAFGQFMNMPILDAYKQVLDVMIAENNVVPNGQQAQAHNQQVQQAVQAQRPTHIQNEAIPSQALAPTNSHMQEPPRVQGEPNWGELSDEEYLKKLGV